MNVDLLPFSLTQAAPQERVTLWHDEIDHCEQPTWQALQQLL
jgi:hypothetical protein